MKVKRAALLGLLACLIGASASAQIAPGNTGDIGLFTMPTADTPRAGMLTFGVYGWKEQLIAGNLAFSDTDARRRLYSHWAGEASIGLGLTDHWTVFGSAGEEKFQSRGGWRGGALNSVQILSRFDADEPRKIRIGTKYKFVSESDPGFRVALFGSAQIPISHSNLRRDQGDAIPRSRRPGFGAVRISSSSGESR